MADTQLVVKEERALTAAQFHALRTPRRNPPPSRGAHGHGASDQTLTTRPPPGSVTTPAGRYRLDHYPKTRYWAVHEGDDLLAVTVYKRGARAVMERLQTLDHQLAEQQALIARLAPAGETALPRAAEAATPDFQEHVSRPTEQLALFSLLERAACHRRDRRHGLSAEYV